jgi:hypothetical protein
MAGETAALIPNKVNKRSCELMPGGGIMIRKIGRIVSIIGVVAVMAGCSTTGSPGLTAEKSVTPSQEPERTASLSINPKSGKANAKLDIHGSGFVSGEKILLLLTAEMLIRGKSIGTLTIGLAAEKSGGVVTADEKGIFTLSRKFPVNVKPGVYPLEARGDKGSKATCPLEILGK